MPAPLELSLSMIVSWTNSRFTKWARRNSFRRPDLGGPGRWESPLYFLVAASQMLGKALVVLDSADSPDSLVETTLAKTKITRSCF